MIDLRGPCGHLLAQLDPERGVIICKCRHCSFSTKEVVLYAFDTETGAAHHHQGAGVPESSCANMSVSAPNTNPGGMSSNPGSNA